MRRALHPPLEPLDPKARDAALIFCYDYHLDYKKVVRQMVKEKHKDAKQTLRKLAQLQKKLANIKTELESMLDPIRRAHIPLGRPVPFTLYRGLKAYFRPGSDPARHFMNHSKALSAFEMSIEEEVRFLENEIPKIPGQGKIHRLLSVRKAGCLEHLLMRLFKEHSTPRLLGKKAEEHTARILIRLGKSSPNINEGCAAIRVAVRRLPEEDKQRCSDDLARELCLPRHPYA